MDKIVVYYHKDSDTLDIWFGNPEDESTCEEAGEGIILKKTKPERPSGLKNSMSAKLLALLSRCRWN
jgi:hypothetical protein